MPMCSSSRPPRASITRTASASHRITWGSMGRPAAAARSKACSNCSRSSRLMLATLRGPVALASNCRSIKPKGPPVMVSIRLEDRRTDAVAGGHAKPGQARTVVEAARRAGHQVTAVAQHTTHRLIVEALAHLRPEDLGQHEVFDRGFLAVARLHLVAELGLMLGVGVDGLALGRHQPAEAGAHQRIRRVVVCGTMPPGEAAGAVALQEAAHLGAHGRGLAVADASSA